LINSLNARASNRKENGTGSMINNIECSINRQLEKLQNRYKKEIKQIEKLRDKKDEFYYFILELHMSGLHLKATNSLLPFYYILTHDDHMEERHDSWS
jgi:hypothetical protein